MCIQFFTRLRLHFRIALLVGLGLLSALMGLGQTPVWAFLKGQPYGIPRGVYGTQGIGSVNNIPPAKSRGTTWQANGLLYYFGGDISLGSAVQNDLWSYNPATGVWTWLTGTNGFNSSGSYGTKGVAAQSNTPGARYGAYGWVLNNKLYLFGGQGFVSGTFTLLNDMWEYDLTTGWWTWLGGTVSVAAYGAKGVPSKANVPGARYLGAAATANGKLLLFGGRGVAGALNPVGHLNDVWAFNPTDTSWTWLNGDDTLEARARYGTTGTFSSTNNPGAGWYQATAGSNSGFYIFGGTSYNATGNDAGYLDEVWEYHAVNNQWRLLKGNTAYDTPPAYGTQGVYASANTPGSRRTSSLWLQGNKLVLFGGNSTQLFTTPFSDWWDFDLTTNQWRWIGGTTQRGLKGNFGTRGVAAATNYPGSRQYHQQFQLGTKCFILGGSLTDRSPSCAPNDGGCGSSFYLNDFWEYDINIGLWTWKAGSNALDFHGIYGTQGTVEPTLGPGGRTQAGSVTHNGKLYLLGGQGFPDTGANAPTNFQLNLNDLWEYDPATGNWRWVGGGKLGNEADQHGTQGVASPTNWPGARYGSTLWKLGNKMYVFGGNMSGIASGTYNDLWEYDFTTGLWRWLKGSATTGQPSVLGTQGVADPANTPGGRSNACGWVDNNKLYLYGGFGRATTDGNLNQLWEYDPATNNWRWLRGSAASGQVGIYGTQGVATAATQPGSRNQAIAFAHGGKGYVFGGQGLASSTSSGRLNDLWEYDPASNEWRWLKGSNFTIANGVYGTLGAAAPANTPGARSEAGGVQRDGKLYLFGGLNPSFNYFNDVWEYNPATNLWRWIAGFSFAPVPGALATGAGVDDVGNYPGGRSSTSGAWSVGNYLYFFSGNGRGVSGGSNLLQNDLWRLNLAPPAAAVYTFTGSGNWSLAANWSGSTLPPNPVPSGAQVIINGSGDCILDIQQVMSPGALLSVSPARRLVVQGNLLRQ